MASGPRVSQGPVPARGESRDCTAHIARGSAHGQLLISPTRDLRPGWRDLGAFGGIRIATGGVMRLTGQEVTRASQRLTVGAAEKNVHEGLGPDAFITTAIPS